MNSNLLNRRSHILVIGNTPPPVHGASVMIDTLLRSRFSKVFDVKFVETRFNKDIETIERFTLRKVILLAKYLCKTTLMLLRYDFDYCIYNISAGGNAIYKDWLFSLLVSKVFHQKLILYSQGKGIATYDVMGPITRKLVRSMTKTCFYIVVVGKTIELLFYHLKLPQYITSIHNGLPVDDALLAINREYHKRATILYLSYLDKRKGLLVFLETVKRLVERDLPIKFIVCGAWFKEEERHDFEKFVQEHFLEKFVECRGKVYGARKIEVFREADIFFNPTEFDSFSLVNLEAMMAGLPIVTTAEGAIPEVVEDGVNGYILAKGDVEGFVNRIAFLIETPDIRKRMAHKNREKFLDHFTDEKFAQRWIDFIYGLALKEKTHG